MENILEQLKTAIGKIETKHFERNERDFAYELYHQMKKTLKLPPNIEITSEATKKRFSLLKTKY